MLVDPAGRQLPVSLQLADGPPKEPVRVHLYLYTGEQGRHVERLAKLGATRKGKRAVLPGCAAASSALARWPGQMRSGINA
jgi:hypothetical protein